ncbi:MAG: crossover junction endodeoxyribonuclease RuvC [Candidatus Saelkia tenebricola]|nr:crossover junction endodeoxyribonuclease RuvC [Candidatus Saelkia tenebricola]
MKILGIDPGLDATGFACIELKQDFSPAKIHEDLSLVEVGTIFSGSDQSQEERLKHIHSKLKKLITGIKPDAVVVEDIYSNSVYPKSGLKMGHVKGVVELAVAQAGIKLSNLNATKIKKSLTGRGNATKVQVAKMIENTFNMKGLSNLHESDALAAALAYIFVNLKKVSIV